MRASPSRVGGSSSTANPVLRSFQQLPTCAHDDDRDHPSIEVAQPSGPRCHRHRQRCGRTIQR